MQIVQRHPARLMGLRPFAWVILVINALFVLWIIAGTTSASDNCAGMTGSELDSCELGTGVGTGIAIVGILFLWAIVDVILLVIFLVTHRDRKSN